jgi:hypothetical protein
MKKEMAQARSLIIWITFWLFAGASSALAAPAIQTDALSVDSGAFRQPIDVVVLLDDSGSMATCWPWPRDGSQPFAPPCGGASNNPPSDPNELRYSAARLLLQLAGDEDRVALVHFDNGAEGVGDLGALQAVGDAANRQRLTASLAAPTNYLRRGYTRIDLGLQAALDLLQANQEPGRNQYVLLLTDGEPSGPQGFGGQGDEIRTLVGALRSAGVLLFPVVLCNPTAGCAGKFLSEQVPELGVRQVATPQELLRAFSDLFAAMKPDLSVIDNRGATLQLTMRPAHGVRRLTVVTARDGLVNLQRDDQPLLVQSILRDPTVDVNVVEGEALVAGRWSAQLVDASGFAVVQSDSYPQLLNPPPSLANSPAALRYYPAGKPLLLLARSGGPGAAEPLRYNGETPLQPFGDGTIRALRVSGNPSEVQLQLGEDQAPLQLVRTFRLEARSDLPRLAIFSPRPNEAALTANGRARLQVGFGGNTVVQNLTATVFVSDQSNDEQGKGKLVYQASLLCNERLCSDEGFTPGDGRSYQIIYVVQAQKDGLRFSDWGEAALSLKPAIQVTGLPEQLDLAQMPAGGWPVELTAGATEAIGALTASLLLRRNDTGEAVQAVQLDFRSGALGQNVVTSTLHVDGLQALRPGEYSGEVSFKATRPNGQLMDVEIRPANTLPVRFAVARPLVRLDSQLADFGELLFDTSPNFRIDQEVLAPLTFVGKRFKLTTSLLASSCPDLTVVSGDLQQQGEQAFLPLRLTSRGPVSPATCTGLLRISGPDADHDVTPTQLDWQVRVNDVEWSLVTSALDLGDLQDAGGRAEVMVALRFTGKTPFLLEMVDLQAEGRTPDAIVTLSPADLEMSTVEVTGAPNAEGVYQAPITLVARRALPRDEWRGAFYSGALTLGIVGLTGKSQAIDLRFRSPSLLQRYVSPYVTPVYARLPWALCAWPLTLLLLLVVMARVRGRGIDEAELEEAAVATVMPMPAVTVEPMLSTSSPSFANPASGDAIWGASEWGNAWGKSESTAQSASTYPANGSGGGDPWRTSW